MILHHFDFGCKRDTVSSSQERKYHRKYGSDLSVEDDMKLNMIVLTVSSLTQAEAGPLDLPLNGFNVIDDHTVGGLSHPLNEKNSDHFSDHFSPKKRGGGVIHKGNLRRHI